MIPPLLLRGRGREVRLRTALLLAPMDGVTDPAFRGLVLGLGHAGGAVTEFVRITTGPISLPILRREVGPPAAAPVGLQLMAPDADHLAETAARAADAGASWLDLNFGCPAKRVFNKCAGSALLAHPERIEAIVAAAVAGTDLPVTAKVRAGIEDASRLEEVLDAAARGGAAMITLHARLRTDSWASAARWEWIARGSAFLRARHPGVALVGNGGVARAGDASRLLRETNAAGAMAGRAALADPWVFREALGGAPATPAEAADFAVRYLDAIAAPGALRAGVGKAKQFVRAYGAGGLFDGREEERARLLRGAGVAECRAWFAGAAAVSV